MVVPGTEASTGLGLLKPLAVQIHWVGNPSMIVSRRSAPELPADPQSPVNDGGQVDTGALGRPFLNQLGQGTAAAQLSQDPVRELFLRGLYGSLSRPRFVHGGPCLLERVGVCRGQFGLVEAHPARLAGAWSLLLRYRHRGGQSAAPHHELAVENLELLDVSQVRILLLMTFALALESGLPAGRLVIRRTCG